MEELLNVSSNPHVRDNKTTAKIMLDVLIALLPASAFGVYQFGIRALIVILVTVAAAVLAEACYDLIMKKPLTIFDCSAAVTGLLLALNLPVSIPIWIAILGSFFAIIVVKMVFGGLGQNFMNPALGARCFLLLSFTGQMTKFTLDGNECDKIGVGFFAFNSQSEKCNVEAGSCLNNQIYHLYLHYIPLQKVVLMQNF